MPVRKDITGQRFGRLVPIRYLGDRKYIFRCDCGNQKAMVSGPVVRGVVKSCGCAANDHKRKHGMRPRGKHLKTYSAWREMRARCNNPRHRAYNNYGGRGITVCKRWSTFANFLSDMGEAPAGTSIDRIDNNGGYSPDNCRWATNKQQSNNRSTNIVLTLNGRTMTATEWAAVIGVHRRTIYRRLRMGLPADQVLSSDRWRKL